MEHFMQSWTEPSEIVALIKFKLTTSHGNAPPAETPDMSNHDWAMLKLVQTSRSFAAVIEEMHPELKLTIALFYLVLRALDTIEDDMTLDLGRKLDLLTNFHRILDVNEKWSADLTGCGVGDEQVLVTQFHRIVDVFGTIAPKYQAVVKDITARMGAGMVEFAQRPVVSEADYDLYCHYVAGLVGIGLTRLFGVSGLEDPIYSELTDLANSCGLLLQKTNITRDYLEDIIDGRIFWPRAIWERYAASLDHFKLPEYRAQALQALNHMICNAIEHVPDTLEYIAGLKNLQVFRFVAFPQVMAIATLARCYNNGGVFEGAVKIRKGETAKIFLGTADMDDVYRWFLIFVDEMRRKIAPSDPVTPRLTQLLDKIAALCLEHVEPPSGFGVADVLMATAWGLSSVYLLRRGFGFASRM
eukprot:c9070_g1_i2.p2 GENE.c9070_g1_i2~~c9070_g1_i2.p2  ORF type:complete len:414 (+),score=85.81 c9070_g1_i2:116-1357(+)